MKVKVIRPFFDKYNLTRQFNPGEVVEFEDERAENIVLRGLGEKFIEKSEAPTNSEKKKPGRKRKTE